MGRAKIVSKNFVEDISDYFSENNSLGYTLADNFLIGEVLDVDNIDSLIGNKIDLTVYDEGGTLRVGGRFHTQERSLRFLVRDTFAQGAINKSHDIASWIGDNRYISTTNFVSHFVSLGGFGTVVLAHESGTYFSDVVVTFLALAKG